MDNTELHYVSYDPDDIWLAMQAAYVEAGGDILYPGDEKEMLLRADQAVIVQAFGDVDTALRMATLRYATGEYLDLYGERRNCYRIVAQSATATVEITFAAGGRAKTIPAGTALSVDGVVTYLTLSDVYYDGSEQKALVDVECSEVGVFGNGLLAGTLMQFVNAEESVAKVEVKTAASGGMEAEEDEAYRERIHGYGINSVTTGPAKQYESMSLAASSEIIDALAKRTDAGKVGIYLILAPEADEAGVKKSVLEAVNPKDVRPLTDKVDVYVAQKVTYTLKLEYSDEFSNNIVSAIAQAVRDYQAWQDNTIGRAFNPDRLISMAYQAGATRVRWGAESQFNGGAVEYTEIEDTQYCSGVITTSLIGA